MSSCGGSSVTSAYRSRCHAGSWWCQMVGRPSRALATAIEAGRFIGMDPRFSTTTRSASATADRTSAVRRSISAAVAAPTPWSPAAPSGQRPIARSGTWISTCPSPATVRTSNPRRCSASIHVSATMETPSVPPSLNESTAHVDIDTRRGRG